MSDVDHPGRYGLGDRDGRSRHSDELDTLVHWLVAIKTEKG